MTGLAASQILHLPKWRGLTQQELHVIAVNDAKLNEILNMGGQLHISKSPEEVIEEQPQPKNKGKGKEIASPKVINIEDRPYNPMDGLKRLCKAEGLTQEDHEYLQGLAKKEYEEDLADLRKLFLGNRFVLSQV